jgi:outer membrane protein assembly factor BamA
MKFCMLVLAFAMCGYPQKPAREKAVDEGYWAAVDSVQWGPLFKIHSIRIFDEQENPLEGIPVKRYTGIAANRKNIMALQAEIKRYFLNQGFPFAVIHSDAQADSMKIGWVDVEFHIHRGYGYKLGIPKVSETRSKPEIVQRLALWESDDTYNESRVNLGLQRLRRRGYFESTELTGLFRDSTRNLIYPALRLPDAHDNHLSGLLGYDSKATSVNKLTGYIDLHLLNLFGTARDLDFSFDGRAGNEREAHLVYAEPWLFGTPVGTRLELNFLQQDTVFWEWNRGLTLFQDLSFTSRLEAQFGDQENRDAILGIHTRALRSGLRLIIDARDRVPLTASGYHTELGVTGIRRNIVDSLYYLAQGTGKIECWVPLISRQGLKFGLNMASNLPLNRINRGEIFYVGGANSLRGYREREFWTNAYALGQLEWQLWLGRGGRLFAFTDPGLVNHLSGEYSFHRVIGYGAGMELSKGDWGISFTYALNPERAPGDALLHLGVDNRF